MGQRREALRLLLVARRGAVEVRRRALVHLRSVIVTAPDRLRQQLQALPEQRLLERCSRLRRSSSCPVDELATKLVLRTLARRVEAATAAAQQLERELLAHVRALAPQLLDEPGVGPIVAADMIVAWSHPGRVRSEAAFARLAGVAPSRPPAARQSDIDSAAAAIANSTALCTRSSCTAANTT
jgi:transposase